MAEPHVITALVEKYRVVSGQLVASEMEAERLKSQLGQLEAVIRMFRADYPVDSLSPKRTLKRTFLKRNLFMRTAMEILREAKEPMAATEIARLAFEAQGDTNPDPALLARFAKNLNNTLIAQAKEGKVVPDEGSWPWRWVAAKSSPRPSESH
jgi:hypothetical protein